MDPSVTSLTLSAGTLNPPFASTVTSYTLTVPPGVTSVAATVSVAYPTHATILVAGVHVPSGVASAPQAVGLVPSTLVVSVTAEGGQSRSYSIVLNRSAPTYFKANNAEAGDVFGSTVALSGDGATLVVGAPGEDSGSSPLYPNGAPQAGAAYVFVRTGTNWVLQSRLKAPNAEADDGFGASLAITTDGSLLAVGAPGEDSSAKGVDGDQTDNTASGSGAVYVFTRSSGVWSKGVYLKASNTTAGSAFGSSVALTSDGSRLAVGASKAAVINGAAYVFSRSAAVWQEEALLVPTTGFIHAGSSVALSTDGLVLAVGAPATGHFRGEVFVYSRSGTQWTNEQTLVAHNLGELEYAYFGTSVAMSGDGATVAVGAPSELSQGAVYVFTGSGATWSEAAYLKSTNIGVDDGFGTSIGLSSDGLKLLVGAPGEDSAATGINGNAGDDSYESAGAAYLFTQAGGVWGQSVYVKAPNTEALDSFGCSVALSSDGATLAVGANGEASAAVTVGGDKSNNSAPDAGAAFVY